MADLSRRPRAARPWHAFAASAVLTLVACSEPAPRATTPPPSHPPTLSELLPLQDATVFSYEVESDLGERGLLIMNVRRPRPERAELDIAGRVQRLDVTPRAIAVTTGGFLLRAPIEQGRTFQGSFGSVRVEQVAQTVTLPAGKFEGCVVTVEESARPLKRSTSTYCPGVGLVSVVIEGDAGDGDVGRIATRLKSHGPRVDLQSPAPSPAP